MDILSVLTQVRALLQQERRLSYRILKRQFAVDDDALEDLKYELIGVQEVAVDRDGKMLVWVGEQAVVSTQLSVVSSSPLPTPQTPNPELPNPRFPTRLFT